MIEGLGVISSQTIIENADSDSSMDVSLLAQADTGSELTGLSSPDGAPSGRTSGIGVIVPDTANRVTLTATASLEDIQLDGDDLLLIQPDGSQIRVIGGALNVPTFIIGDIELPQEVLVAALDANGFNVAAGPGNTLSVSPQAPTSSGGEFDGSSGASIAGGGTQALGLLGDTSGNGDGGAAGGEILDPGNTVSAVTGGDAAGGIVESADTPGGVDADPLAATGSITFFDPEFGETRTAEVAARSVVAQDINGRASLSDAQLDALRAGFSLDSAGGITVESTSAAGGSIDWTYFVDNDAVDFLSDGEVITLSFDVRINDGVLSTLQTVTITVTGTNDAPVIGAVTDSTIQEDDLANGTSPAPGLMTATGDFGIDWCTDFGDDADTTDAGGVQDAPTGLGDRSLTFGAIADQPTQPTTSDGIPVQYVLSSGDTVLTAYKGAGRAEADKVFEVSLSDDGTGSYNFVLLGNVDHNPPGSPENAEAWNLDFTVTATDAGGDTDTGTFSVIVTDDTPVIGAPANARVDEDDLSTAGGRDLVDGIGDAALGDLNIKTDAGLDADGDDTTVAGDLAISWGADDADDGGTDGADQDAVTGVPGNRSVTFADLASAVGNVTSSVATAATLTSRGDTLVYSLDSDGTTLTASADDGTGLRTVFTVSLSDDGTGSYVFDLNDGLDHPTAGSEDNIDLFFNFTATDSDGDSFTSSFSVGVDDDGPVAAGSAVDVTVDEDDIDSFLSTGTSPDGPATQPAFLDLGPALPGPEFLGFAVTVFGSVGSVVSFGADGAAASGGFSFTSGAVAKMASLGLTSGGDVVSYEIIGDTLVAYVDAFGSADYDGYQDYPVFTLELDPVTGDFTFRMVEQLDHVSGNNENTDLQGSSGPIGAIDFGAVIQATDGDGDTVVLSGKVNVTITDDVPEPEILTVDPSVDYIRVDETYGPHSDNTDNRYVADLFAGVTNPGSDPDIIDTIYARYDVVDYDRNAGADDYGSSRTLTLQIDNAASGLVTTEGEPILLSLESGLVMGRIDGGANDGNAVFAIHVSNGGRVSIAQYQSIRHPDTSDLDEHVDLAGKISAVLTITDADGDTVIDTVSIGTSITFDDDGPDADDVVETMEENPVGGSTTISLVRGSGPDLESGEDFITGADGGAANTVTLGTVTYRGVPAGVTPGTPGISLTPTATGYDVTITPGTAFDALPQGETLVMTIPYTVEDGDGDTVTKNIEITVTGTNDAPVAVMDNGSDNAAFRMSEDDASKTFDVRANDTLDLDSGASNAVTVSGVSFTGLPGGIDASDVNVTVTADNQINLELLGSDWDQLWNGETGYVRINYRLNGDNGEFSGNQLLVRVNGLNDAPVLDAAIDPSITIAEDAVLPGVGFGTLVSDLVDRVGGGGLDNVTDDSYLTGIAITGQNTVHGTWYFSTNDGASWSAINGVTDAHALTLRPEARVFFVPAAAYNGSITDGLTIRAWDGSGGTNGGYWSTTTNGGTTGYSSATDTISITVTPAFDDDTLTGGAVADTLYGDGFEFTIPAGSGPVVNMTFGNDVISGESGNDYIVGDANRLNLVYVDRSSISIQFGADLLSGGDGTDTIYGDVYNYQDYESYGSTSIATFGDDTIDGGNNTDYIYGDGQSAQVFAANNSTGGAHAGTGTQSLIGGNDILDGGAGADIIYGDFQSVTVSGDEGLITGGNDTIRGGAGNDELYGDFVVEVLSGGGVAAGGDDILNGGLGRDMLNGGGGADTFVFDADALVDAGAGIKDLIADYNFGEGDVMDLSALLGAENVTGDVSAYLQMNGDFLEVDVDGLGAGAGFVQIAEFTTAPAAGALKILVDDNPADVTVVI